jgi:hypothetical protein
MSHGKRAGGFAALEDYDGYEFVFENGYCARFEFKRDETRRGAHPYKYSLTLHSPSGRRLVGFDNAHPVRRASGRFKRLSKGSDHWHRDAADKGRPFDFKTPENLLEDFFREVERVLRELSVDATPSSLRKRR